MNAAAFGSRSVATSPFTFTINNSHSDVNRIPQHDSRQDSLNNPVGYDRIAQDLRTALRDDDVEMEDASDWPTSWENSDNEQESQSREAVTFAQNPVPGSHSQPLTTLGEEEPRLLYIALDTNIFISHLKTVQAIHEQLSQMDTKHQKQASERQQRRIKLLVPNIVIHELDKQKNLRNTHFKLPTQQNGPEGAANRLLHDSQHAKASSNKGSNGTSPHALTAAARSAIEWLLQIRQGQRRGGSDQPMAQLWVFQKKGEVVNNDIILSKADDRILDCCEYYQNDIRDFSRTNDVILWTDDKNLSLQAEIHDITCIGNRAYSAEQVLAIAQKTLDAHRQKQTPSSAAPQNTKHVPLRIAASHSTVAIKRTPPKRPFAATAAAPNKKSSMRGITSSIWASTAHTGRNSKTNGSNGKTRASSLPLLSDYSTTGVSAHRPSNQHGSGTTASAQRTANNTPPRLADAITVITTTPSSPSTLDIALGHILAFPLYDLLLEQVCRNQPTVLRQFLGPADLGPGHWNGNDCLTLLLKGWQFGLRSTYLANQADAFAVPPQASFEALSWLQAFLFHQKTSKLASRENTATAWQSVQDRMRAIEAIRILFIRKGPNQWWLDNQHLHVIERLVEWLSSNSPL